MSGRHRPPSRWRGPVLVLLMLLAFLYLLQVTLGDSMHSQPLVSVPACRDTGTDLYRDGRTWWTQQCDP